MTKSVTIKLDDELIKMARHLAVNSEMSLSAWVSELIKNKVETHDAYNYTAQEAIRVMEEAGSYGGRKVSREDLYSSRTTPKTKKKD